MRQEARKALGRLATVGFEICRGSWTDLIKQGRSGSVQAGCRLEGEGKKCSGRVGGGVGVCDSLVGFGGVESGAGGRRLGSVVGSSLSLQVVAANHWSNQNSLRADWPR